MLTDQKLVLKLTNYLVEVKNRKTTSARRQTTANRTSAFATSRQNMSSFSGEISRTKLPSIAAFMGLAIRYLKAREPQNTRSRKRNYQRLILSKNNGTIANGLVNSTVILPMSANFNTLGAGCIKK